jgi:hypothetical protein
LVLSFSFSDTSHDAFIARLSRLARVGTSNQHSLADYKTADNVAPIPKMFAANSALR